MSDLGVVDSPASTGSRGRRPEALLQSLFGIQDTLIEDFSAAYRGKILLHGRLYVCATCVAFYSNIFGHETKKVLPYTQLVKLRKKIVHGVNPGLEFVVPSFGDSGASRSCSTSTAARSSEGDGERTIKAQFCSFFPGNRDKAFALCSRLFRQARQLNTPHASSATLVAASYAASTLPSPLPYQHHAAALGSNPVTPSSGFSGRRDSSSFASARERASTAATSEHRASATSSATAPTSPMVMDSAAASEQTEQDKSAAWRALPGIPATTLQSAARWTTVLEGSLPLTVPQFFEWFLADDAAYSMQQFQVGELQHSEFASSPWRRLTRGGDGDSDDLAGSSAHHADLDSVTDTASVSVSGEAAGADPRPTDPAPRRGSHEVGSDAPLDERQHLGDHRHGHGEEEEEELDGEADSDHEEALSAGPITRTLSYRMPLPPAPLTPASTRVEKTVYCYRGMVTPAVKAAASLCANAAIGPALLLQESARSFDVPYGDYFTSEVLWAVFTEADGEGGQQPSTRVHVLVTVEFQKSTLWRSKIQTRTIQGVEEFMSAWFESANKHCRTVLSPGSVAADMYAQREERPAYPAPPAWCHGPGATVPPHLMTAGAVGTVVLEASLPIAPELVFSTLWADNAAMPWPALLVAAGYSDVRVSPWKAYGDAASTEHPAGQRRRITYHVADVPSLLYDGAHVESGSKMHEKTSCSFYDGKFRLSSAGEPQQGRGAVLIMAIRNPAGRLVHLIWLFAPSASGSASSTRVRITLCQQSAGLLGWRTRSRAEALASSLAHRWHISALAACSKRTFQSMQRGTDRNGVEMEGIPSSTALALATAPSPYIAPPAQLATASHTPADVLTAYTTLHSTYMLLQEQVVADALQGKYEPALGPKGHLQTMLPDDHGWQTSVLATVAAALALVSWLAARVRATAVHPYTKASAAAVAAVLLLWFVVWPALCWIGAGLYNLLPSRAPALEATAPLAAAAEPGALPATREAAKSSSMRHMIQQLIRQEIQAMAEGRASSQPADR